MESVKRFERAGGTHLVLSHLPYHDLREWDENGYGPIYERTVGLAERSMQNTDVEVYVTLGPYPVDLVNLEKKVGLEKAKTILIAGMDLAAEYVQEGKALALGEIGRPHFEVPDDIFEASNEIMKYGMKLAADLGCSVVLHTESTDPETCEEFGKMADDIGLDRGKVVKHYSPPLITFEENKGLFPSVLASEKNLRAAAEKGNRFIMETDFLDDPKRPGAVLGIKNVPKKTKKLLDEGVFTEDDVWKIHKENPEEIYDIEVEL